VADTADGEEDLTSGEEKDYPTLVGRVTPAKIKAGLKRMTEK
jgi:hypothetical protein